MQIKDFLSVSPVANNIDREYSRGEKGHRCSEIGVAGVNILDKKLFFFCCIYLDFVLLEIQTI